MGPSLRTRRALAVGFLLLAASACATSPTGRHQLRLLSDAELDQMGAQAFQDLKAETAISRDRRANDFTLCVVEHVVRALPQGAGPGGWDVALFQDETPNAFALPGGKIGVHTGMLDVATSQGQLAAVIGHEIAHVLAGHPNERASQQLATQGALTVVGAAAGEGSEALLTILGAGAQVGILLPFSRNQESEADVLGLQYMSRAGFDPRESVRLWENMARASEGAPPEFLSTHPSGGTRIKELQAHMDEALARSEGARAAGRRPDCDSLR